MQFEEKQKVSQLWIWGILLLNLIVLVYGTYTQVYQGKDFGSRPVSDTALILITVLSLLLLLFVATIKMTTTVDESGIQIQFFPFFKVKKYDWGQVAHVAIKKYSPLREFGGWGIRFNKKGIAYTLKGNHGLELELQSGEKILIGTQKQDELQTSLKEVSEFRKL